MVLTAEEIITRRLEKELAIAASIALGDGIPSLVAQRVGPETQVIRLNGGPEHRSVDVAVVEASEVSSRGDLALGVDQLPDQVRAARWIVASRHNHQDGTSLLVSECRLPVSQPHCVATVITELGVIEVADFGLVLREIAPGVAADEVKLRTSASLHVADDIVVMEL